MSMTAKLFSISGLSIELGRDRRTIGKALARVAPDGQLADGTDAWYLRSALTALEQRSDGRRERGNGYTDDSALNALEDAAQAVEDFFCALRAEPDIGKRRKLLERDGKVIGEFSRRLEDVQRGHSEAMRMIEAPFVDKMSAGVFFEALDLCNLTLKD
jgi:hypothetical protein